MLDSSDVNNYRPNQLQDPNQSGFKPMHSTETALIAVTEKLQSARSAKLSSILILLDLSAAFDMVNRIITGYVWKWFKTCLEDCSYQLMWSPYPVHAGSSLMSHKAWCWVLFSFLFTLALLVSSRISACLSDISSWMAAHHLKLNPIKTELLLIPATTGPHHDLAISFENSLIVPSVEARSLGVILDGQLLFSNHIANLTQSVSVTNPHWLSIQQSLLLSSNAD